MSFIFFFFFFIFFIFIYCRLVVVVGSLPSSSSAASSSVSPPVSPPVSPEYPDEYHQHHHLRLSSSALLVAHLRPEAGQARSGMIGAVRKSPLGHAGPCSGTSAARKICMAATSHSPSPRMVDPFSVSSRLVSSCSRLLQRPSSGSTRLETRCAGSSRLLSSRHRRRRRLHHQPVFLFISFSPRPAHRCCSLLAPCFSFSLIPPRPVTASSSQT